MRRTRGFNPLVCGDLFFGYLFSALPDPSARWPPLRRGAGVSLLPLSVRSFGGIELLLLLFSEVADLARPPESPKARARQPPKMHPSARSLRGRPRGCRLPNGQRCRDVAHVWWAGLSTAPPAPADSDKGDDGFGATLLVCQTCAAPLRACPRPSRPFRRPLAGERRKKESSNRCLTFRLSGRAHYFQQACPVHLINCGWT